jgi:hypothetical protein
LVTAFTASSTPSFKSSIIFGLKKERYLQKRKKR